jgi:hypothetical protein
MAPATSRILQCWVTHRLVSGVVQHNPAELLTALMECIAGKQDPYCIIHVEGQKEQHSKVSENTGASAAWNQTLNL